MYEYKSGIGGLARACGGLSAIVSTAIYISGAKVYDSTEEFFASLAIGATIYFIGDKIHKREIDQAIYAKLDSIDKKLSEPTTKDSPLSVKAELIDKDGYIIKKSDQ